MAEKSMLWSAPTTGDGSNLYTESETVRLFRSMVGDHYASEGLLYGVLGELAPSGVASPISVADGVAFVNGYFYWNTLPVNVTVPTPSIGTTGHRIVLQWIAASNTVRIALLSSSDGVASLPAITQTPNVQWEIVIANLTITTGGVITLTDVRTFCHYATKVSTGMLDDGSVTAVKMADGAALAEILDDDGPGSGLDADTLDGQHYSDFSGKLVTNGNSHDHSGGDGAQIPESGLAAAVQAQLVTNGDSHDHSGGDGAQIPSGGIANNAVDDTKVGNRVPQFYRRQGGNASDWNSPGTSNYTPGAVRMQAGRVDVGPGGTQAITFPVAFSAKPLVFVTPMDANELVKGVATSITASGFTLEVNYTDNGSPTSGKMGWLAIGPE
jgi:hypothetical protein